MSLIQLMNFICPSTFDLPFALIVFTGIEVIVNVLFTVNMLFTMDKNVTHNMMTIVFGTHQYKNMSL